MNEFVHLHVHSEYSLLDGAARVKDLAEQARKLGQSAIAITDHGVLFGAVQFYEACKQCGVKPIIGCEVYVAKNSRFNKETKQDISGNHLVLLVENEIGYKNLIKMVSLSFTEGFYMKPRVDLELLNKYHEGLIALSGCLAGSIPQAIIAGDYEKAKQTAIDYQNLFGKDHFYLEVQDHGITEEKQVLFSLDRISKETGIPLVATNDSHYILKRDSEIQTLLMCISMGKTLDEGKPFGFETNEFYLKSTEEMYSLFSNHYEALQNTKLISDRCNFDFTFGELHLPSFEIPKGETHEQLLRQLTYEGLQRRIDNHQITFSNHTREEYSTRIEYELSIIHQMGFDAYYLIVQDFVMYSKNHGITVGPGRGSGAGSLVAFCVGITDVDSIEYDLYFERFLNPDRVTMPDFDIDFSDEKRSLAIQYVKQRYGEDHVAQIITFGTLAAVAALKDISKVLKIESNDVDQICSLAKKYDSIPEMLNDKEVQDIYTSNPQIRKLLDYAKAVEGMPRHSSTHAAGVIITEKPISEYVPVSINGDVPVSQFDMDTSAKLGLVKFDFLGIRYITIIDHASDMIRKKNPSFDITKVPFDDQLVYKTLSLGNTDGVFQLESAGVRRVLQELKPTCFEDIIATIALYRPGPMDSIPKFIARKHGKELIQYDTPLLEEILKPTYGCIVYQEQVMQICRSLAGYTLAHADMVRRAMSKKKADVMAKEKDAFVNGCKEHGIDEVIAQKIFSEMESFASYAFNKSHATAYAVTTYRTAYLKTYYPAEYFAALMSAGNIVDSNRFGITVLPPDINESDSMFSVKDNTVRYGFLAIKNVGISFVEALLRERDIKPFASFEDFLDRMANKGLNRRQVEVMIKVGCFDSFEYNRAQLLLVYEQLIDKALQKSKSTITGQIDFFSSGLFGSDFDLGQNTIYPDVPDLDLQDKLKLEKELTGFYFSGSFFDKYTNHAQTLDYSSISEFKNLEDESIESLDSTNIKVCGCIEDLQVRVTKKGEQMLTGKLEDRTGSIEFIVFPKTYATYGSFIKEHRGVYFEGKVQVRDNNSIKIIVLKAIPLLANDDFSVVEKSIHKKVYLKVPSMTSMETDTIQKIIKIAPGPIKVIFFDESKKKYYQNDGDRVLLTDKVKNDLIHILGEENVVIQ